MPLIPPFDILPLPAYLPSVEMGIRDVVSVVIVIVSLAVATISLLYCIVNQKITRFMSFIDLVQRLKKDLPLMFGDDQEVTERQNMSGKQGASGQGVIKELDDLAEGCLDKMAMAVLALLLSTFPWYTTDVRAVVLLADKSFDELGDRFIEACNSTDGQRTADKKTFDPKNTVLKNRYARGQDVSRI